MILRLLSDGVMLADKEIVSIDPKKPFGAILATIIKKLNLPSVEGHGLWLCEGQMPPLPLVPVERTDTPERLGARQGDVLYVKKETAAARRAAKETAATLKSLRASGDDSAYAGALRVAREAELRRQRAARRLHAMRLLGTEWTQLDPSTPPADTADCAICLTGLSCSPADPVELSVCSHRFHETCLLTWMGNGAGLAFFKCPVCRVRIVQGNGMRSFSSLLPRTPARGRGGGEVRFLCAYLGRHAINTFFSFRRL